MDHVHHDPRPAPDGDRLAVINREIAALFDGCGDRPLDPVRLARYHVLRDEYVALRQGRARGREGEDDEAQAA
jgi:hypothetical protein